MLDEFQRGEISKTIQKLRPVSVNLAPPPTIINNNTFCNKSEHRAEWCSSNAQDLCSRGTGFECWS